MSADTQELRADLAIIADWIRPGANVLDLGCGDGALLDHLFRVKKCHGYGVEIDDAEVLACARRGVDVVQRNIEDGLEMFRGGHFDVVVLSMALQATKRTEMVLDDMSRVAGEGIVSFPNFGHWFHVWSILRGRMPVTREMPYEWFNTPNLHLTTPWDFEDLARRLGLVILERAFLCDGHRVRYFPVKRSTLAIYRFRRG
ncbi:MAG: methionine biosynthesis protein MetW [Lautropia sp.]|nr:methionine biosynthesis protein MetW [Lautropia sp.]